MTAIRQPFVGLLTPELARRRNSDAARRVARALLLLLGALAPAVATAATPWQSIDDIQAVAERFVAAANRGGNATAKANPLDSRLRLPQCNQALEAFLRSGARVRRRTVVGVRCSGAQPWKVYVPVDVVVMGEVFVLRQSLPRGHPLRARDVVREKRDVSRVSGGYIADPGQLLGQRLKQSLVAGSMVTPSVLKARTLIRRGQTVTIEVQTDGLNIRMAGKALMDGALEQRIRVENTVSQRVVEGLVRSAETVEVLVQ